MAAYITRRLLQAIPVIFLITVVSFMLMQQAPGGPASQFNGVPRITVEQVDAWLTRWCLERNPDLVGIVREYLGWLGVWNCQTGGLLSEQGLPNFLPTFLGGGDNGILHGDLGFSTKSGRPVAELIVERIPATLVLMVTAFVIWVSIAVVLGVIAAVKRYSLFDNSVTLFSYVFYSLPTFWLGLILIYFFAVQLRWLPSQGIVDARNAPAAFNTPQYWEGFWADPLPNILDIGRHLVLPVITLVAVSVAADSRFVRSSMLDVLSQDYVRTARAKGLPRRRVVFHHAFRNALLPILTTMSLQIAFLFSGAIVTETVFSWPGMGRLYFEGVTDRDYFLLMGILLVGSILVVIMNIVADVLYAFADPRIRY
ncbi:MAG: ABC transporter permease [Chloroflexota bacterium]